MPRLAIVGSSGHGRVVLEAVRRRGDLDVVGFIDRGASIGDRVMGVPILGREQDLPRLRDQEQIDAVVIAIGDNAVRARVATALLALWPLCPFATIIHPSVQAAADVVVGPGSMILAGAVLNTGTVVGRHCIVNTGATADHDNILEDFCSLGPGAVLGGNVRLGPFSAVSLRAGVIHGVTVGAETVVGAGAIVLADLPPNVVAYGTPCKVVRGRAHGDRYL